MGGNLGGTVAVVKSEGAVTLPNATEEGYSRLHVVAMGEMHSLRASHPTRSTADPL
jgi:hypothetical protein